MKGQISKSLSYITCRPACATDSWPGRPAANSRSGSGLCYDAAGNVMLDPDSRVHAAVTRLFTTFEATGSATTVVKAFAADKLTFPARDHAGPRAGELYWKPLRLDQVLFTLHNPRYAGAYCYGRRADRGGDKITTAVKPREDWITLIPGAHDSYITWAQFEAKQQRLAANAAAHGGDRKAGPTKGRRCCRAW